MVPWWQRYVVDEMASTTKSSYFNFSCVRIYQTEICTHFLFILARDCTLAKYITVSQIGLSNQKEPFDVDNFFNSNKNVLLIAAYERI